MGYSQNNSKGVTYYLNTKTVTLNGGRKQPIYYFSKDKVAATHCDLPADKKVVENERNGTLFCKKK